MSKLDNAKYRYGFTGTLDGSETHKWVLEGLFGPSFKIKGKIFNKVISTMMIDNILNFFFKGFKFSWWVFQ